MSCADLASQYIAALPAAQSCDVNAIGQCQQLVNGSLPLSICNIGCQMTFVNDATTLNALESAWNQAGCKADVMCPNIACAPPSNGGCVAADGGGGICNSITLTLPTN